MRLVKAELARAQNRMKQLADKKRSEREFLVGEKVYLKLGQQHLKALTHQPISKLSPKYYGPFPHSGEDRDSSLQAATTRRDTNAPDVPRLSPQEGYRSTKIQCLTSSHGKIRQRKRSAHRHPRQKSGSQKWSPPHPSPSQMVIPP